MGVALRGCFVTGTDTEVGKTQVSAALLHALGALGWRVAGLKPVAAGIDASGGDETPMAGALPGDEAVNGDVRALRLASNVPLTDAEVGPCQLRTPCAPSIAAQLQGVTISRPALLQAAQALARRADLVVVEGVGGFRVPLGPGWDSADLAADLGLPVLLVVGLRLGCLNHALLTADAVRARGLRLAGWVANHVQPAMPLADENLALLTEALQREAGAPRLAVLPWLADPSALALSRHLAAGPLQAALGLPRHGAGAQGSGPAGGARGAIPAATAAGPAAPAIAPSHQGVQLPLPHPRGVHP